jgi:hypothetical protein
MRAEFGSPGHRAFRTLAFIVLAATVVLLHWAFDFSFS